MSPIDPKVLDRLKKLLRLGQSSNEHEAAGAAARAAELVARHNIDTAHVTLDDGATTAPVEEEALPMGRQVVSWRAILAGGCAASQGAESWHWTVRRYGAPNQVSLVFAGTRAQIDASVYLYNALANETERLADVAYRREQRAAVARGYRSPSARAWKNAFRLGCAGVIADRLRAQRETTVADYERTAPTGSAALVHLRDQDRELARYVARKGLRKGRPVQFRSRDGFAAGKAAGADAHIGGGRGLNAPARRLGSGR